MSETTLDPRQSEQRRLIEQAAALAELEEHPGYATWRHYAEMFLNANQGVLAAGNISDIGEYRMIAGRVQGIQQLLGLRQTVELARDRALEPDERYEDELSHLDNEGD